MAKRHRKQSIWDYNPFAKRDYNRAYRSTPEGAAACAWNRLTSRAGGKYGHRGYSLVEVRMTRDEFIEWAVPEYDKWFIEHPDETPSIDRIESTGHYELGNLQIIGRWKNCRKNRRNRQINAPPGTIWCSTCQDYRSIEQFYGRKRSGGHCIPCAKILRKERWRRIKASRPPRPVARIGTVLVLHGIRATLREHAKRLGLNAKSMSARVGLGMTPHQALTKPVTRKPPPYRTMITFNGETLHLAEHCRRLGLKAATVCQRINRGASPQESLAKPFGVRQK